MSDICYNCFQTKSSGAPCTHCGYDQSHAREEYPLALPHGTILNGQYILGRVLGQGGFGITYVAQEHRSGKLVAVKEYLPDGMATRTGSHAVTAYSGQRGENFRYGKECFLKEAQTLAEFIGNPGIVRVYSYFEENGTAYFVMDYVEGISFQHYIENHNGKIEWQDAMRVILPVMNALEAVHSRGIIHRDVTPDNIFITGSGEVKLLDFGAARYSLGDQSRSLDVVLKHGFAPREQYTRHGRQGPYTDVYSVAASFYYAVIGKKPPDAIDRIDEDYLFAPSSLGVSMPAEIEDAILKGMSVHPADRFQRMGDFVAALKHGCSPEPPKPEPPKPEPPKPDPPKPEPPKPDPSKLDLLKPYLLEKKKWIIPAALLAVILLVVFIGKFWAGSQSTSSDGDKSYSLADTDSPSNDVADTSTKPLIGDFSEPVDEGTETIFGKTIAFGSEYTVGLRSDGTVVAVGDNGYGQCEVSDWRDIVSVSTGNSHTVGLKSDGTVVAVGDNEYGQCEVSDWRDIVSISTGNSYTVGLKSDGTVVAVGNNKYGQCEVSGWRDVVSVSSWASSTVGLKSDGTVVAVGWNGNGQYEVSGWRDIVSVNARSIHTVGLKSDGTVVAIGDNKAGQCEVSDWRDIVSVSTGNSHTVGLKSDGTVVAAGDNKYGQCEVSDWRDIVSVSAGLFHTVGLKSDGTVVAAGASYDGRCEVSDWSDIVSVFAGDWCTVGLKSDGTVVAVGDNENGQCEVSGWSDIAISSAGVDLSSNNMVKTFTKLLPWDLSEPVDEGAETLSGNTIAAGNRCTVWLKSDGTVAAVGDKAEVSGWRDIVSVSAGALHTVGLKKDGTVVAVGISLNGRCEVSDWRDIVSVSAGDKYTVGLKKDGTVVAVGDNDKDQCEVSDWRDIVSVSAGKNHTVGLRTDGTVVAVGNNSDGQCEVSDWKDIKSVSAGGFHTVGLKTDGTVVAVGGNGSGQCEVSDWSNIISVSAGFQHTVGLKSDGTVVAVGYNADSQCEVSDWSNIVSVSAGFRHTTGLRTDGTVVAVGDNEYGQCEVSGRSDGATSSSDTSYQAESFRGYILPESDSRYLAVSDLKGLSQEECRLARNELYARHGRRFDDEGLQAYFDSCEWYHGTIASEDFDDSVMNRYEVANRDLIVQYEKDMGYR